MQKLTLFLFIVLFNLNYTLAQEDYKTMMNDNSINFYQVCKAADTYFEKHDKGKGSGWKAYQRWKFNNESKYYPSGDRSNINPYSTINAYKKFLKNNPKERYGGNAWKELGPFRIDSIISHHSAGLGRVEDIFIDPNDTLKMCLGSRSGGFWRTTDGGVTWKVSTDSLPATSVNTLSVSRINTDLIMINSANALNGMSHGIYFSNDGGESWTLTNFNPTNLGFDYIGSAFRILKIAYHPRVPNLIFVGTNKGLYKSTDNLQTWTLSHTNWDVSEIEFHLTNDSIIYVYDHNANNRNKVFISSDQGETYTASASIPGNSSKPGILSVSSGCASCLYFASDKGVWKSTNNGHNFTFLSNPNGTCLGFSVNDIDTSSFIYGYLDVYASNNGGKTFNQATWWDLGQSENGTGSLMNKFKNGNRYVHADLHPARCVNGVYYIGTDGLFAKSNNNGINWTILNQGTAIRENYHLGVSQSNHFRSMSGSQDNGISIKHKDTWIEFVGGDGMVCIIHPLNDDFMIGSTQSGGRTKTINGGRTKIAATPPNSHNGAWEAPLVYDPNNQMRIYDFRDSIYVSDDFGDTWSVKGKPSTITGTIHHAAIAQTNSDIMVISRYNMIEISTNGGASFEDITNNLPAFSIGDIAFDPNNDSIIIIVYGNYNNENKTVFITKDKGANWKNITYNLENMPIHSVIIDHTNASNIYVGAEIGIYTMPMNDTTWSLYSSNLPNTDVEDMEVVYGSNTIKAVTWGRGLWECSLVGRNNYPAILRTSISDMPTKLQPKFSIDQFVTATISYSGTLSSVYIKWSKDTISLDNSITMSNTQDSTWVSDSAIPNFEVGTKIYFKVFAVGSNNDTSETYRFMYIVKPLEYCEASGELYSTYDLHIKNVSLANINNNSANDFYKYYSDSVIYLYVDSTYTISVKSNIDWESIDFGAWIDFNNNVSFNLNENLNLVETENNLAQNTFTVSADVNTTDTLRLRVRVEYWDAIAKPCGTYFGEVEDYPVKIIVADTIAPIPNINPLPDLVTQCAITPSAPTATDNVSGEISAVPDISFPITNEGTTIITWTYTDEKNNSSQQTQNVIITPIDTSVLQDGNILQANASGFSYQWIDCNNYLPISGETNQSFITSQSGNYAVVIYNQDCQDTSSCINTTFVSIKELENKLDINLYPNPSSKIININKGNNKTVNLQVLNTKGEVLINKTLNEANNEIDIQNFAKGIYLFKFIDKENVYFIKVIKN